MKRIKLFKVSALLLFIAMACNKKNVTTVPGIKNSNDKQTVEAVNAKSVGEMVKEKMYNLTPEQIKFSINFLTASVDLHKAAAKSFMPESNLLPDSSLWVLEAALNYHFDNNPKDHEVSMESVEFSAPLT